TWKGILCWSDAWFINIQSRLFLTREGPNESDHWQGEAKSEPSQDRTARGELADGLDCGLRCADCPGVQRASGSGQPLRFGSDSRHPGNFRVPGTCPSR